MRTLEAENNYEVGPDELQELLTSRAFLEERHRLGPVADARVVAHEREGESLLLRVATVEYGRTRTGGVDQSRTDPAETVYEWDLAARRCTWRWTGPHGDRIRIQGTLVIEGGGVGSILRSEFRITANAPLIGRVVERLIAREIQQRMPDYDLLLRQHIDRAALG